MPVVEIGQVRVRMRERLVLVRVRVPHPSGNARMNVAVVSVIVPVAMRVLHSNVYMHVLVSGSQHDKEPRNHQCGCPKLSHVDALA